jgi:hypothetical protein
MKKVAKETSVVEVPAAPVVEWIPQPKYAKTMANTIGGKENASELVLVSVNQTKVPREGTARAAAFAALVASIGQPQPAVLAAVAEAEQAWHMATTRTPKAVSPAGWLRTYGAKFGPAK